MCGLIAYIGFKNNKETKENAKNFIIDQYQRQFTRGTEGFGLICSNKTNFNIKRATEPIKAQLDIRFSNNPILLFHHRTPTSTDNELEQTHPLFISHNELKYNWYIMHNGIIKNDKELKTNHEKLGYKYQTEISEYYTSYYEREKTITTKFNDSETFAIEITRYLEGLSKQIEIEGSFGFLAMKTDKKTNEPISYLWGKDSFNPISHIITKKEIKIASELQYTDTKISDLTANEIFTKDLKNFNKNKIKSWIIKIPEKKKEEITYTSHLTYQGSTPKTENNFIKKEETTKKKKKPETLAELIEQREESLDNMTTKKSEQLDELTWSFFDIIKDEKTTDFELGEYQTEINKILSQAITAATYINEHYQDIEEKLLKKRSKTHSKNNEWNWDPKINEEDDKLRNENEQKFQNNFD